MSNMDYTPKERAKAIYYYIGYRYVGTINQIAFETGLSVQQLLHDKIPPEMQNSGLNSDFSAGWFGVRTCDLDWRVNKLLPKYVGNVEYWYGVICGYWITGGLS